MRERRAPSGKPQQLLQIRLAHQAIAKVSYEVNMPGQVNPAGSS
jgi:hypothetical protein